jgi:hypothetical protein
MSELNTPTWKRLASDAVIWKVVAWVLALGAFTVAAVASYRQIHYNIPNDLRSPTILVVDTLLATVVAFGFALHGGSLTRWTETHLCLRFGIWSAAVFRLVPPIMNEEVLYFKGYLNLDVPYVILGAVIHGGLAILLAYPYATRVLKLPACNDGENQFELCGSVVLVFLIVACVVRLFLADKWW